MLLISGQPNAPVRELWDGKVRRSFAYGDGARRRRDLAARMMQVQAADGDRYVVYPARDKRVMRIVRKIIRGLCHHHELVSPVHDGQVWADVQRFEVPPAFVEEMTWAQAEKDVFQYRFGLIDDPDMHSCWLLRFFDRTSFFGIVFRSIEARARLESRAE